MLLNLYTTYMYQEGNVLSVLSLVLAVILALVY